MSTIDSGAAIATGNAAFVSRPPLRWRVLLPTVVTAALVLMPVPEGLPQHAWYFFAIFADVIVGLMVEPLPAAVFGLVSISASLLAGLTWIAMIRPGPSRNPRGQGKQREVLWL